jgi:hypothetical protein
MMQAEEKARPHQTGFSADIRGGGQNCFKVKILLENSAHPASLCAHRAMGPNLKGIR